MTTRKKMHSTKIYPVVTTVQQGMFYLKRGDILVVDENQFWLNIRKINNKIYVFIGHKKKNKKIECFSTTNLEAAQKFIQFLLEKNTVIYVYLLPRRNKNA